MSPIMVKIKKIVIRTWPYIICVITGYLSFYLSSVVDQKYQDLLINISATLFAVPILFLVYDVSKTSSNKRLYKELFDYAKMQVDQQILSVCNQLMKIIGPYGQIDLSAKGVSKFLNLSEDEISQKVSNARFLGFQVLKSWTETEKTLTKLIENAFILESLNTDQKRMLPVLLKQVYWLQDLNRYFPDLFEFGSEVDKNYRIQLGSSMNSENVKYPNRYLLLEKLKGSKYRVTDFGDFRELDKNNLLNVCSIKGVWKSTFVRAIYDLLECMNEWLELTGGEIIINSRMFRQRVQS